MHVCVQVFECTSGWPSCHFLVVILDVHIYVCACTRGGQKSDFSVIPQDANHLGFELVSLTCPEIAWFRLAVWLVSPGSLRIPNARITSLCHHVWILGIELGSLCSCGKHFTGWAFYSSPMTRLSFIVSIHSPAIIFSWSLTWHLPTTA